MFVISLKYIIKYSLSDDYTKLSVYMWGRSKGLLLVPLGFRSKMDACSNAVSYFTCFNPCPQNVVVSRRQSALLLLPSSLAATSPRTAGGPGSPVLGYVYNTPRILRSIRPPLA